MVFRQVKLREFSTTKPVLQQIVKGTYLGMKQEKEKTYLQKINTKQLRKCQ